MWEILSFPAHETPAIKSVLFHPKCLNPHVQPYISSKNFQEDPDPPFLGEERGQKEKEVNKEGRVGEDGTGGKGRSLGAAERRKENLWRPLRLRSRN